MTTMNIESVSLSRQVAAEIRATLGRQGINQTELAKRLGTTGHWVSTRISPTAKVDMTLEEIAGIAKVLQVSLEDLLRYAITDSNREPADSWPVVNEPLTLGRRRRSAWALVA